MRFALLVAVVVALGVVEVGHFPIQIAKMKTQVIQGYTEDRRRVTAARAC